MEQQIIYTVRECDCENCQLLNAWDRKYKQFLEKYEYEPIKVEFVQKLRDSESLPKCLKVDSSVTFEPTKTSIKDKN